jgi:hypothetical protein
VSSCRVGCGSWRVGSGHCCLWSDTWNSRQHAWALSPRPKGLFHLETLASNSLLAHGPPPPLCAS